MSAVPDTQSSGTPLLQHVWSSLFPPSSLFPNYFAWVVNAFKVQHQNIIGVKLSFVGAAAFDPFELPRTTHEAPASFSGRWALLRENLAHALPRYLFAVVQSVHFKTMNMKSALHFLGETDRHCILGLLAHDHHRLGPIALAFRDHQSVPGTIRNFDRVLRLRFVTANFAFNFDKIAASAGICFL